MSRSSSVASNPNARAAAALFTGYLGGDNFPLGVAARLSRPFCDRATSETGEGKMADGGGGPGGGEVSKLLLGDGESPPPLPNCVCVAVEIFEVVEDAAGTEWSAALPSVLLLPLHDTVEVVVAEAALLLLKDVVVLEAEVLFAPPTP